MFIFYRLSNVAASMIYSNDILVCIDYNQFYLYLVLNLFISCIKSIYI